jgi:hypothetical protein
MTFPTRPSLQVVWQQFAARAATLKRYCQEFTTASAARAMSASDLEEMLSHLAGFSTYAKASALTPGLEDYVKAQYADSAINIVTEYNTMIAAVDAAIAWIAGNVPKSGGYVQLDQWANNGTITRRTFSTASLAGLRTVLDSVAATIE